ncbi:MerR family transcriptional regulator [Agrococcus sp. DT81.2]|uniref:MerR family transcriptional regulator n=1 Tax=Agrococcus sp. DT81.2 TaxID=3393414 RepID=UPI003CE4E751
MRISELSARTGVPVPTIKYYLRERILPPGERTSATQAQYDEAHERRLRLVRALVEVAGLSIERVRRVLAAVDEPSASMTELLHRATDPGAVGSTPRATAFVHALGWEVPEGLGALAELERGLGGLEAAGLDIPRAQLVALADAMDRVAEIEIEGVPTSSSEAAVAYAVLGTELVAPILLSLRRIAHARHTIARFGDEHA